MIARGDLGIEVSLRGAAHDPAAHRQDLPAAGPPVIVATHMLESMIEIPMPTRAEVTDVANAVFEQADAIMLSGETTVGQIPVNASRCSTGSPAASSAAGARTSRRRPPSPRRARNW